MGPSTRGDTSLTGRCRVIRQTSYAGRPLLRVWPWPAPPNPLHGLGQARRGRAHSPPV